MVFGSMPWMPKDWEVLRSIPEVLLDALHRGFPKARTPLLNTSLCVLRFATLTSKGI